MSRRHHHHMQPYDYDRFGEPHQRDRNREPNRGIEYQDDSLSSINSDEESYLHHTHPGKDKKPTFYLKPEASNKPGKAEKPPNDTYHQKDAKPPQPAASTNAESSATLDRLGRLETMLEELMKRYAGAPVPLQSAPEKPPAEAPKKQFVLEPRRHAFTTSMWINKIQEVSIQNNWNEKNTIQYMEAQMSGIIKAWYNSLPKYDFTWPEWKILLTKIFPDNTDFITTLKRLVTRLRQGEENMATYYFSKMYLIEACKITGEDAVSCLIDGLNNQAIQEQARLQNFLTPETLYSQFLMALPDYTVDYSPAAQPTADTMLSNWYYQDQEHHREEVAQEVVAPQQELFNYEQQRNEEFEYQNQNHGNPSFRGNEDDPRNSPSKRLGTVHSRLDKRFMKPNNFKHRNKMPMAAKVCTFCFMRGHLAKHCMNIKKMLLLKPRNASFSKAFFKNCTINGHKLIGLVDTGCTIVTVKECEARMLNLLVIPIPGVIETYGGGKIEVLGETDLLLEVDSVRARVRATVVPDCVQEVPLIIGQSFLNRKNVSMLLENESLKFFEDVAP